MKLRIPDPNAGTRSGGEFKFALILTLLVHGILLALSPMISMDSMADIEEQAHKLFNVKVVDIKQSRFDRSFASREEVRKKTEDRTEELLEEKIEETMEWEAEIPPVPEDIPPMSHQDLENREVFQGSEGETGPRSIQDVLDNRGKDLQQQVVEIASNVGREMLEERRRQPSTEGNTPFSDTLGEGGGSGEGGLGPGSGFNYGQLGEPVTEAGEFKPTVPGNPLDLALGESGLDLRDSNGEGGKSTVDFRSPIPLSPDRDDELSRYEMMDKFLRAYVETYHDEKGRGYFRIIIQPNSSSKELKILPKDIIYVLDASGSIGRRRLQELRGAIIQTIMTLGPQDRFNVLGFKSRVEFLWPDLNPASDLNKALAAEFIQKLRPSGMTNIYKTLASLEGLSENNSRPFIVAMFSDGRANVGVTNNRAIINEISSKTGPYTSVFSFGVGARMNHYLLDLLSYRNKGHFDYVGDDEEIAEKIPASHERIQSPILINLHADYGNIHSEDVYPKQLPDLFLGDVLAVYGRYDQQESCALRIVGEAAGEKKEFLFDVPLPQVDTGTQEIAQYWAAQKIYELIGDISITGSNPRIEAQIKTIADEYGLQDPY